MHNETNPLKVGFRRIADVMACYAGEQTDMDLREAMNGIENIIRQSRWAAMEQIHAAERAEIAELRAKLDATL